MTHKAAANLEPGDMVLLPMRSAPVQVLRIEREGRTVTIYPLGPDEPPSVVGFKQSIRLATKPRKASASATAVPEPADPDDYEGQRLRDVAAQKPMSDKSQELKSLLMKAGFVKGDGVNGAGIKFVKAAAKEYGIKDWPHCATLGDYSRLIAAVRSRMMREPPPIPPGATVAQTVKAQRPKKNPARQLGDVLPDGTLVASPADAILELHDQANPPKPAAPVPAPKPTSTATPYGVVQRLYTGKQEREAAKRRLRTLINKVQRLPLGERRAFLQHLNTLFA